MDFCTAIFSAFIGLMKNSGSFMFSTIGGGISTLSLAKGSIYKVPFSQFGITPSGLLFPPINAPFITFAPSTGGMK